MPIGTVYPKCSIFGIGNIYIEMCDYYDDYINILGKCRLHMEHNIISDRMVEISVSRVITNPFVCPSLLHNPASHYP